MKQALIVLLDFMKDNDRLCLILFNSYAKKLCKLTTTTKNNKITLKDIINKITSTGGTDIDSGMSMAF